MIRTKGYLYQCLPQPHPNHCLPRLVLILVGRFVISASLLHLHKNKQFSTRISALIILTLYLSRENKIKNTFTSFCRTLAYLVIKID
jgi:uncharacterized membrane protein YozB (DUF420 family)